MTKFEEALGDFNDAMAQGCQIETYNANCAHAETIREALEIADKSADILKEIRRSSLRFYMPGIMEKIDEILSQEGFQG